MLRTVTCVYMRYANTLKDKYNDLLIFLAVFCCFQTYITLPFNIDLPINKDYNMINMIFNFLPKKNITYYVL